MYLPVWKCWNECVILGLIISLYGVMCILSFNVVESGFVTPYFEKCCTNKAIIVVVVYFLFLTFYFCHYNYMSIIFSIIMIF